MKKSIPIEVCVCTECVMNGAMDLIESIDRLKELGAELDEEFSTAIAVEVESIKCLGDKKHGKLSPRVSIDGVIFDIANSQTVMAEILSIIAKDVKAQ